MAPAEDNICGLIEFDAGQACIVLHSRVASDETLQATLVSLAQDRLHEIAAGDDVEIEWETAEVLADFATLEQQLLVIYRRLKSR